MLFKTGLRYAGALPSPAANRSPLRPAKPLSPPTSPVPSARESASRSAPLPPGNLAALPPVSPAGGLAASEGIGRSSLRALAGRTESRLLEQGRDDRRSAALEAAAAVPAPEITEGGRHRERLRTYLAEERADLDRLGLEQRALNRSQFFETGAAGVAPRGLVVLLHGFNAGTAQWSHLAADLNARRFDVFIPALPGHGLLAGDRDHNALVPGAGTWQAYDAFLDRLHRATVGASELRLVGISCGGMLALKLAERYARAPGAPPIVQIDAFAPIVELTGSLGVIPRKGLARVLLGAHGALGVPMDALLKRLPAPMVRRADYGSTTPNLDMVLGVLRAAEETRREAKALVGLPVRVIVSEADPLADPEASLALADACGAETHVFPRHENVPHVMVSPLENPPGAPHVEQVRTMILDRIPQG